MLNKVKKEVFFKHKIKSTISIFLFVLLAMVLYVNLASIRKELNIPLLIGDFAETDHPISV